MAVSHTRQNTISYAAIGVTAPRSVVFDDLQGHGSLIVVLEGTFSLGQATFEGTIDRTNWFAIGAAVANGGSFSSATGAVIHTASTSAYVLPIAAGIVSVRLRVSTFTSGLMNVSAVAAGGSLSLPTTSSGAVSGGDGAILDGINTDNRATVFDYANSNPLAVVLRDSSGDYVAVGGGTQYAEQTVHDTESPDQVTLAGVVRRDTPTAMVSLDGQITALITDALGRLQVKAIITNGASPETTLAIQESGQLTVSVVGGIQISDGNAMIGNAYNRAVDPSATDPGLVVRNIPSGTQAVSFTMPALVAGTAIIGKVAIDQTTPGTTNAVQANAGTNLNTSALALEATQLLQATAAKQDSLLTELQLKADLTETQPVSLAAIPINAAAATSAKQDTGNTSLASIDGKLTNPLPVSLPAGFATSAIQTTQQTALDAIKAAVETIDNFISGARGLVTEDNSAAILSGMATAALQTSGNASLTTIATDVAPLVTAQGATGTSVTGPMVQGLVNDTPSSYSDGVIQPLSLTAEGRLRVSSVPSTVDHIWQDTFTVDPWSESPWGALPSIADTSLTFAGDAHV